MRSNFPQRDAAVRQLDDHEGQVGLYRVIWGSPKLGVPVGVPNNQDYNILESLLGSPYLGKITIHTYTYTHTHIYIYIWG